MMHYQPLGYTYIDFFAITTTKASIDQLHQFRLISATNGQDRSWWHGLCSLRCLDDNSEPATETKYNGTIMTPDSGC